MRTALLSRSRLAFLLSVIAVAVAMGAQAAPELVPGETGPVVVASGDSQPNDKPWD